MRPRWVVLVRVKWNTISWVKEDVFSLGQIAGTVTLAFCNVSAFWDHLWVLFTVPQYHKEPSFPLSWVSTWMHHHRIPNYINSTKTKLVFAIFSKEINGTSGQHPNFQELIWSVLLPVVQRYQNSGEEGQYITYLCWQMQTEILSSIQGTWKSCPR